MMKKEDIAMPNDATKDVAVNRLGKLNLGCGNKKVPGYINVDNNPNCKPDVIVDLDGGLTQFQDDSMDEIRAEHVLEHVDDLLLVLNEMYRVSKDGAIWVIQVPHFSYGFVHPFHKRGFSYGTFDWLFSKSSPEHYGNLGLSVMEIRFNYTRFQSRFIRLVVAPINIIANLHKGLCERVWCYWVGGFEEIQYKIRVDKHPVI
jgi:SAM-dependent methyltransferase